MKVVKNFLWNAGYQLFVLIIPFITIPYINRVLGPNGVGINSYTNSIVQYFILLGSLGINIYGNREIAYYREDMQKRSKTFWEIATLRFFAILISVLLYIVFISFTHTYRFIFILQGIMLLGTAFDISWFFQGMENFKVTVLRSTLVKVISLGAIFLFVKNPSDTWIYVLILALSQALGFITLWPYLRGQVRFVKIKLVGVVQHLKPTLTLLIPQIATQVYLQLNKTMLGSMNGVAASGFYDNSDKMVKMLLAIVTATGTVLLPHVANNFAKGKIDAVKSSLVTSMHVILVMAFPMTFGLIAVAHPFTALFFSSRFAPVANLMSIESLVIIFIGISNAIGTQYLLPTNQLKYYTNSVLLGSIVNIILNVPLILAFGAMGAVIATVTSEAVIAVYQMRRVRHQVKIQALFYETWKYAIAAVIMFVFVKLSSTAVGSGVLGIALQILIGVIIYLSVLFVMKPDYLIRLLLKRIK